MKCGRPLTGDEMAVYKRMVNRVATEYLCKTCLSEYFGCTEAQIDQKIEQFRKAGCVLFATDTAI